MSRTTLTPKPCELLSMETAEDSSARYFPLSQTIEAEYVFLFAMFRTIADSSGRCYLLSRTIRDEYVFNSIMSNRLLDRLPGRGVLHTPLARLSSTPSPFSGRLVGRMQYAPTFPEKDKVSLGRYYLLSRTMGDKSVFLFSMSNRLSDRYPCRGILNTPHIDSTSTPSPFAGRLVGRMQYAPTLPAEKSDLKGWWGVMFGTIGDEYVFHSIMSNRLSDGYPGRGAKAYAPCAFIVYPHALCRAFGRAYAICPYPAGRKIRFEGLTWGYVWGKR